MNNSLTILSIFTIFFLIGNIFLSLLSVSIFKICNSDKEFLKESKKTDIPLALGLKIFHKSGWKNLYLLTKFTNKIVIILFISSFLFLLGDLGVSKMFSLLAICISLIIVKVISLLISTKISNKIIYISSFISSIYIYLFFPISNSILLTYNVSSSRNKSNKLFSKLNDINIDKVIDPKFLSSLLTFQEKVVREVMVPRVRVFSLSAHTSIRQAAKEILAQGFSRVPVYKEKIDNIVGVLMYKDILKAYINTDSSVDNSSVLDSPIETLINPVIYAPENKKIFQLFQEFRSKKRHLGIVVNEYGGTEGIITIEDILEEIVGEIQDEYDIDEERQLWKLPNDTWVIDAKLSVIDLEKNLNIHIPHSPEYETIGGFIFHRAGSIPKKGWSLFLDDFEIEVLISNERCIEKVRITPLNSKTKNKEE